MGFAGMKMIRRVVGISHVEDLDGIKDRPTRARCEAHALALGKRLALLSAAPPPPPPPAGKGGTAAAAAAEGGEAEGVEHICNLARALGGGGTLAGEGAPSA